MKEEIEKLLGMKLPDDMFVFKRKERYYAVVFDEKTEREMLDINMRYLVPGGSSSDINPLEGPFTVIRAV